MPARALAELQRLAPGASGPGAGEEPSGGRVAEVGVAIGAKEITFVHGSVRISTRLLEGTYPDYRQLVPDHYPNRLHLGKETLLAALRRVRLLVRDTTTPVRLSMRPGGVDLTVVSQEVGRRQRDRRRRLLRRGAGHRLQPHLPDRRGGGGA